MRLSKNHMRLTRVENLRDKLEDLDRSAPFLTSVFARDDECREEGVSFDQLLDYLNGPVAKEWMEAHCQRVTNGFLRLQNRVLRRLPVSTGVARERQGALAF